MTERKKYYEKDQADKEITKGLVLVLCVGLILGYCTGLFTAVLIQLIT